MAMRLKKLTTTMDCALVFFAALEFSCVVYANQGSNSAKGLPSLQLHSSATENLPSALTLTSSRIANPAKSTKAKLSTMPAFSGTASLAQTSNMLKSKAVLTSIALDESLTTGDISNTEQMPSLFHTQAVTSSLHEGISGGTNTVTVAQTSNLMQTQTVSTSTLHESQTTTSGTLNAVQTPNFSESQASTPGLVRGSISITSGHGTSSLMQSPYVMQTQVGSTGFAGTPVNVTPSVMQTDLMLSQVQSSSFVLTRVTKGVTSMSLPPTTVVMGVSRSSSTPVPTYIATQSYVGTSSSVHANISEYGALLSSSQVQLSSIISTSQSVLVQMTPSGQVSLFTSVMKGESSSLHTSDNRSLDVVAMTTNRSLSSSTPAKPLLSTSPAVTFSTQPSVIPTSQNASSQVTSSAQVFPFSSVIKGESSSLYMYVSANQSLKVVVMTTKASLSSSPPVKPLPSASSVIVFSIPLNITSSGLASYGPSHLLTSSAMVPGLNASASQQVIHPSTTHFTTTQTLWLPSSSAVLSPPTASPPGNPDPPVIQDVSVLSAHSVLLKWNASSTQFIANFSVEFSIDSVLWENATCNQSLVQGACIVTWSETTVTSLKPYTNYTFRVAARSSFGQSNFSRESRLVLTDETAPSSAPKITAAYGLSSQEIYVAWQPPSLETLNGKLQKYQIRIRKMGAQPTASHTPILSHLLSTPVPTPPSSSGNPVTEPHEPNFEPGSRGELQSGAPVVIDVGLNQSYRIGQLEKWTSYEVQVRAVTVAAGPYSDKVVVQTDEDVPSQPTEVKAMAVNSTTIFVNWTEPAEISGVLLKYEVRYAEKDASKPAVKRNVLPQVKSVVFSSLNPFTLYVINVSAFTIKGEGSHSTVQEQTDEGRPSAPQNLSTQSINSTAILVSWEQPINPNGRIKYRLSFGKESELIASVELVYDGESTQYLVSNLKPFTKYRFSVNAYNVKYNLSSSFVVAMETTGQAAPTAPPQNLHSVTNSSSSIILYWVPPEAAEQNGKITSYNVHISSALEQARRVNTNATAFAVTGLLPYTNYSFTVQAVNSEGVGPNSSAVVNRTFEAEPSPPRNVTAKSVNSTAIKVTWLQALHPNGVIRYNLFMRLSEDEESKNQLVYKGLGTVYVVAGLQEYVMYTFTVVSFNIKNNWTSKQVVAMETTHPAEPTGPPQDVHALTLSSTSIQVKWNPPLVSERNGLIIHYMVRYTPETGQSNSVNTTGNRTSIVVRDLAVFMKYAFAVKAWNVVGAGPESEPVSNTTLEDRPSPPTNVAAKTVNSSTIKVTWQAPLHPNGEIFFRLYYWQNSEGFGARKRAYDGPMLEFIVTGLHEYVTYTFMLQAYNVKHSWISGAVNASETTHPAEPSGPPQNVMVLTQSSTSILVKWNPPLELDRNGIITHYVVKYNASLGQVANITTPDNRTQANVTQLGKYTPYYFTVQAVNEIGLGPPSAAVVNTTFEDLPGQPAVHSINITANSLELTWTPPTEPNGVITFYDVCWMTNPQDPKCVKLNAATHSYNIPNLWSYTKYIVSLAALNSVGNSTAVVNDYTTAEGVPTEPRELRAWNRSGYSLFVTWKKPAKVNGELKGYKVFHREASSSGVPSAKDVGLNNKTTLAQLKPYTLYEVTVQAFTGAGGGATSAVTVMTDETAPSEVNSVMITKKTEDSIELSWLPPSNLNGKIGYDVSYGKALDPATADSFTLPGNTHLKVITGLKPFTEYLFTVVAYNLRKSLRGRSVSTTATTSPAAPSGPPRNISITSTTSTSFTLSWVPPLEPNGIIQGYDVQYYESLKPNEKNIIENLKGSAHTIKELQPWRDYEIRVACQSSGGTGPFSDPVKHRTDPGAPPPLGTLAPPEKVESYSFSVVLAKASNAKGEVSYYQVIVIELATDNKNKPVPAQDPDSYKADDLYTYDEARKMKPQLVPYIAAQFSASEFDKYKSFVVGDGKRTGSKAKNVVSRRRRRRDGDSGSEFYNGALEENTFYAVFQRAYVTKDVYTSSSWIKPVETAAAVKPTESSTSTHIGLIVGLILVIVIVSVLIIVAVYFIRRKRTDFDRVLDDREGFTNGQPVRMKKLSRKRKALQKRLMGSTESLDGLEDLAASRARRQPVPIDDFERHVDRMHMDGDHGFSEEYSLVQPDDEFSFQQFLNPANKYKNRYANIVAYDHTRVLLNPIEGLAGSDYVNANFIDGYNRQRAYIAAQGPLMETFDDFWRMMWEQMSSIIVMLTKLEERGRRKCDQYWPERGAKSYGPIQVTLKETLNMSHYTVRKFIMTHKKFPDDDRVIKQFHFTAWPDHGVPSHPTPLLSLVRHAYSANRESVGPMVVHCSAGVGRTGTFVTLDVMLQRISQEDSVDVFGFVRQMRYQRNFMVQTEAQYVFIHDALLEAITCGVTEVEAKDLGTRIRELRQFDSETGYTYLENEFCRLAKEENHPIAFKSASLNCNAVKNRYANILPFESTRVHLKMRPGEMGSDYINANFIDGYCQPRAYIATQAPVPDTFEDFWRLIWEQECATIVMLTREEEAGKVKCHHYWPSEGSRLYGVILVELLEETPFGDYISRKFKLTHTEEKDSHTVSQFQYTDWPGTGVPDSGVGIVDLIGQVQKWQQQSGNTIIVIHCSGGVGRTGVFCGISMMIERLKAEGVIDVFQTVQAMRLQRPAMVQTAEQYEFCYTTLQEYLDSFEIYANFQ